MSAPCANGDAGQGARRPYRRGMALSWDCRAGEGVGGFVEFVAVMAAHPIPADPVARLGFIEPLPQIDVFHRLLVGGLPAFFLPAFEPLRHTVLEVHAVGV